MSNQETMVYNAINCPKISDLPNDESLIVVLTMWRNYLGIKEQITGEEISMNVQHVKSNYPDFTLEMINLAIKYSLTGLLNVELKPYGAFSPLYISTILNEYKQHSLAIKIKANDKIKREQDLLNMNPVYSEEQKKANRLIYLEYYRDNINKDTFKDFKGIMWNFLHKYDLISDIPADKELVQKELMKKRNQFIDLSIDDIAELEQYSIMKKFFELNPSFDFDKFEII